MWGGGGGEEREAALKPSRPRVLHKRRKTQHVTSTMLCFLSPLLSATEIYVYTS